MSERGERGSAGARSGTAGGERIPRRSGLVPRGWRGLLAGVGAAPCLCEWSCRPLCAEVPPGRGSAVPSPEAQQKAAGARAAAAAPLVAARRWGRSPGSEAGTGWKGWFFTGNKTALKNIAGSGDPVGRRSVAAAPRGGAGAGPRALFARRGFCRCFSGNQTKCLLWEPRFPASVLDSVWCRALKPLM